MINSKKKGFTIVELVIVIAVVAILAAVLIPTFSNLVKKANLSADQQAVRQMNTVLAAEGVAEEPDIFGVFDVLAEAGFTAKDYRPLTTGALFFWDEELNRMLLVDEQYKVIYPQEYNEISRTGRVWKSLSQEIKPVAPADDLSDGAVEVKSGEEMAYVLNAINEGTAKVLTISIPEEGIDMMGAVFNVITLEENAGYNITITGGTIRNATSVNVAEKLNAGGGLDSQYGSALFGLVEAGNTLKISNVTFEDINVKNTHVSGAAILIGGVYPEGYSTGQGNPNNNFGKVIIDNVTIKDSTVIGHRNAGALVGNAQAIIELSGNIELINVNVLTVGGRSGMLIGYYNKNASCTNTATISLENCSLDIYKCEQNDNGAGYKDGEINSWYIDGSGNKITKKYNFVEKALVGGKEETNDHGLSIPGWN